MDARFATGVAPEGFRWRPELTSWSGMAAVSRGGTFILSRRCVSWRQVTGFWVCPSVPPASNPSDLLATNSEFYDSLWAGSYLTNPRRFNTWPLVASMLPLAPSRLEVGPGLRPRLPIAGTHFVDLSPPAIARLSEAGGLARLGQLNDLPFGDGAFDLVAAFDVIEHIADDRQVFAELSRVLRKGGCLIFAVPLHPADWSEFDDCVGHARRYVPVELVALLAANGLVIEKSAAYGMRAKNPRMVRFAVKGLTEHRAAAIRWYNWLFFPIGLLLQKRLRWADGLMDCEGVDELLLVCRQTSGE